MLKRTYLKYQIPKRESAENICSDFFASCFKPQEDSYIYTIEYGVKTFTTGHTLHSDVEILKECLYYIEKQAKAFCDIPHQQIIRNIEIHSNEINHKLDQVITGFEHIRKVGKENNTQPDKTTGGTVKNNCKQMFIELMDGSLTYRTEKSKHLSWGNIYKLPSYKYRGKGKKGDCKRVLSGKGLDIIFDKFIQTSDYTPILILGHPYMGKSQLISYICRKYNFQADIIAIDIGKINIEVEKPLLKSILEYIGCNQSCLSKKLLILDGFGSAKKVPRVDYYELIKDFILDIRFLLDVQLIITSRINLLSGEKLNFFEMCNIITLTQFKEEDVKEFIKQYTEKTGETIGLEAIDKQKTFFRTPFILYLACVFMDWENVDNLCLFYEKLFSIETGIFSRPDIYSNRAKNEDYGNNHKYNYQLYQEFAFALFSKGGSEEVLRPNEYKAIIEHVVGEDKDSFSLDGFLEMNPDIYFIDSTLYNFYLSEYFFNILRKYKDRKASEWPALLNWLFMKNAITPDTRKYLQYKILNKLSNEDKTQLFNCLKTSLNCMIKTGMTAYTSRKNSCSLRANILQSEAYIFSSILCILNLVYDEKDAEFLDVENRGLFFKQIYNCVRFKQVLDLSHFILEGIDLPCACLQRYYFEFTQFVSANLRQADFTSAKFNNTVFRGCDLREGMLVNVCTNGFTFDKVKTEGMIIEEIK